MGQTQTTNAVRPPDWFGNVRGHPDVEKAAICDISQLPIPTFLDIRAIHPQLAVDPFPLEEYQPYCVAALNCDPNLNKLVYACVPKKCTEAQFWSKYFCHVYLRIRGVCADGVMTKDILLAEDDRTSNTVICLFQYHQDFIHLSKAETDDIMGRDKDDDEKLAIGINFAKGKDVIPKDVEVEPTKVIDVMGRTADNVAAEIITALGDAPSKGCIMVLQGLSGTGKGTTVSKLQATLPKAHSWSNGNLFRSLTLLAVTYCEQNGINFRAEVLTQERLAEFMGMLSFDKFDGQFDIKITGLGMDYLVSKIANTVLKEPRIGKNIPTVAQFTQGEVINFAAAATAKMSADGYNVLMEGRAQTLNFVRTPHRFELMLKEPLIIGMRRAAQRMVAKVVQDQKALPAAELTPKMITELLEAALNDFLKISP